MLLTVALAYFLLVMNSLLKNVWIGVDINKISQDTVAHLSNQVDNFFHDKHIDCHLSSSPHMTVWYFNEINKDALANILSGLHEMKEKYHTIQLVNPTDEYDQTFHKLDLWKSNVNNKLYLVLIPHNVDSIFFHFIQQHHISPHISLAEITGDFQKVKDFLSTLKYFRDQSLSLGPITVDINKIHISF